MDKALRAQELGKALDESLRKIYLVLEESGREYELTCSLTNSKENLIKLEVKYEDKRDRDRIWDKAAEIISEAIEEVDQPVNILCGIYRLRS